jgi:hypothetical protein
MKYLSWDVGIKNLAYCLIDIDQEKKFKILKWGIIRLCDEDHTCNMNRKNGKICGAKATYIKDENAYCKTHSKDYDVKEVLCDKIEKKGQKCNNELCKKNATMTVENVTYCTPHGMSRKKALTKNNQLVKITKQNSTKIPIQDLLVKLVNELDLIKDFLTVDEVLIENQPTLINPTMKTISVALNTYFTVRGLSEKKEKISMLKKITFICPSNKIKVCDKADKKVKNKKKEVEKAKKVKEAKEAKEEGEKGEEGEEEEEGKEDGKKEEEGEEEGEEEEEDGKKEEEGKEKKVANKTQDKQVYIMTKALGIKLCRELIKEDLVNTKLLEGTKKKDDLCDAFLQAYHYIYCKNGVTPETEELLKKLID